MGIVATQPALLLIDTCGDGAGVAICRGDQVVASAALSRNGASSEIVDAVRRLVAEAGCGPAGLHAVAVVSGPGSFTGVRVGIAAAKGLAEALQLTLVTVSRLDVLSVAAHLFDAWAVLDGGRSGFYVAEVKHGRCGPERLIDFEALREEAVGRVVAVAEEQVATMLRERAPDLNVLLRPLRVDDALAPSLLACASQAQPVPLADANYLALERDIYPAHAPGHAR